MAEYIDREKILSKVKNNYIEDAKNGYDYYDYLLQDDLMSEPTADVIERSKINKAIEEIISLRKEYPNDDYYDGKYKVLEIIKKHIGE